MFPSSPSSGHCQCALPQNLARTCPFKNNLFLSLINPTSHLPSPFSKTQHVCLKNESTIVRFLKDALTVMSPLN